MENVSYLCSVTDEVTRHRHLDAQTSRRMLVPYTEHLGFLLIQMDEIWKPVLGYEGLYEVSSLGRVKSLDRVVHRKNGVWHLSGRILSPAYCKDSKCPTYITPVVILTKNGVGKVHKVAPLVCAAFHGYRPEGYQCMHLDGNPKNNNADNLSWGTIHENSNEPIRRHRLSEAAKKKCSTYVEIRSNGWPSKGVYPIFYIRRLYRRIQVDKTRGKGDGCK